jgi:hypothetical protein
MIPPGGRVPNAQRPYHAKRSTPDEDERAPRPNTLIAVHHEKVIEENKTAGAESEVSSVGPGNHRHLDQRKLAARRPPNTTRVDEKPKRKHTNTEDQAAESFIQSLQNIPSRPGIVSSMRNGHPPIVRRDTTYILIEQWPTDIHHT